MSKFKYPVILLALIVGMAFNLNNAHAVPPAVKAKSEFLLADELFNKKDYKGAIEHAEKAKSILGKSNSRIEYMLTKAYYHGKKYDKAFIAINAFFEITPESESSSKQYNEMVALYSKLESAKKANDSKPTWDELANWLNSKARELGVVGCDGDGYGLNCSSSIASSNEIVEKMKDHGRKDPSGFEKIINKLHAVPYMFNIVGKDLVIWEILYSDGGFYEIDKITIKKITIPIGSISYFPLPNKYGAYIMLENSYTEVTISSDVWTPSSGYRSKVTKSRGKRAVGDRYDYHINWPRDFYLQDAFKEIINKIEVLTRGRYRK